MISSCDGAKQAAMLREFHHVGARLGPVLRVLFCAWFLALAACAPGEPEVPPLRVILIPADGGTEDGTKADYQPLFDAVARSSGLDFELRVGQSYSAVVEALCGGAADIAFVGAVTYLQATERGCAELLAVAVDGGQSVYYSGFFAARTSPIRTLGDLRGRRVAFGDVNSTSSFAVPMVMLIENGIDPARDLGAVRLTASHADSLAALVHGQTDAAALSLESFDKAVAGGAVDPDEIRLVARSMPLPYPPLILSNRLPEATRARLREAFARAHTQPGVTPQMIRGYGGKVVERYDTTYPADNFEAAARRLAVLDKPRIEAILARAGER